MSVVFPCWYPIHIRFRDLDSCAAVVHCLSSHLTIEKCSTCILRIHMFSLLVKRGGALLERVSSEQRLMLLLEKKVPQRTAVALL